MDYIHRQQHLSTSCFRRFVYNPVLIFIPNPGSSLCSMVLPNAPGDVAPTPPAGFMEYLALLSQNGSLLSALQTSSLLPTPMPPPSTQGHLFSHPNCGMGGALVEKQKALKDITASATKRKTLVDPDAETPPPSEAAAGINGRQTKHLKSTKVCKLSRCPQTTTDRPKPRQTENVPQS